MNHLRIPVLQLARGLVRRVSLFLERHSIRATHDVARARTPGARITVVSLAIMIGAGLAVPVPADAAERQILLRPDLESPDDFDESGFGRSIDFDGDVMVVGAPREAAIYVFQNVSDEWQHVAKLPAPGTERGTFAETIDLDDDVMAVGEPTMTVDGQPRAGMVHVYERGDSISDWQHVSTLTAPIATSSGYFGTGLAVSGDRVLVSGHPSYDPAAYLFEPDASGDWVLTRTFAGEDGSQLSVADSTMEGDRIAFAGSGNGYVYEYGNAGWLLADTIELGSAQTVALEGDVLVFGAPGEDIGDLPRVEGVAYVFERDNGAWQQRARLISPNGGTAYGYFGLRLDLQDGLLVIGEGHETGGVLGFMKNADGEWTNFFSNWAGSMHGILHVPAISARTLAIGYSRVTSSRVDLYDVADAMAEADEGGDQGDDDQGNDDQGNDDQGNDDQGNDDQGNDDQGNDDETSEVDSTSDTGTGSGSGGTSSSFSQTASATTVAGTETDGSRGGGAFAWLLPLVLLAAAGTGRRRRDGVSD